MKKLKVEDYNLIEVYLQSSSYYGYNSNFVTMMMWDHVYNIHYKHTENYLFLLYCFKGTYYFSMPYCKESVLFEVIEDMKQIALQRNFPFCIDACTEPVKEKIQKIYGSKLLYSKTRDYYDYIYNKHSLETLSGKKMQKRRNHYNAFLKYYPNYVYKEIEEADILNVKSCLQRWIQSSTRDDNAQLEYHGIDVLLENRNRLPIKTGCIYINGVLEAFTIGSMLSNKTVQIHVEKANRQIRGLYVAISKLFLEHNYKDYEYVNREEDLGIDSMRVAKKNMHPCNMIKKYVIQTNDLHVLQASPEHRSQIKQLWIDSFQDETIESTEFYFSNLYHHEYTYVLINNNEIFSCMQIVPYQIEQSNEVVYFIVGVATKSSIQGNGYMKQLLNTVLSMEPYASSQITLQAYVPEIYYPFGFQESHYLHKIQVNPIYYADNIVPSNTFTIEQIVSLYQRYCTRFNHSRSRDLNYYKKYLLPRTACFNQVFDVFVVEDEVVGTCIVEYNENKIIVHEVIYENQEILDKIIGYYVAGGNNVIIYIDIMASIKGEISLIPTLLSNKILSNQKSVVNFTNEIY